MQKGSRQRPSGIRGTPSQLPNLAAEPNPEAGDADRPTVLWPGRRANQSFEPAAVSSWREKSRAPLEGRAPPDEPQRRDLPPALKALQVPSRLEEVCSALPRPYDCSGSSELRNRHESPHPLHAPDDAPGLPPPRTLRKRPVRGNCADVDAAAARCRRPGIGGQKTSGRSNSFREIIRRERHSKIVGEQPRTQMESDSRDETHRAPTRFLVRRAVRNSPLTWVTSAISSRALWPQRSRLRRLLPLSAPGTSRVIWFIGRQREV